MRNSRSWMIWVAGVGAAGLLGCGDDSAGDDDAPDAEPQNLISCEVAILGGGAGGLHTAFRLAPELGDGVCLFEKEAQLGGRIKDEPMDNTANSPRFGTGAMRVMETQQVLFDLATELGITLELAPNEADVIKARGMFASSKEAFVPAYPGVTPIGTDTETGLLDELRGVTGNARPTAVDYPDFRSYIRATVGEEAFQFLHDMSRFRADFEAPLDAEGYLDYLDEEWDVCCDASYPVGGMSRFIVGMEDSAVDDGARIFKNEMVTSINRVPSGGYRILTSGHTVEAQKVVIAIPPTGFDWIEGDVAEDIQAQDEYKAILAIPVITVAQWWPNRWWENIVTPTGAPPADQQVWRAFTTEHCFNIIEMPLQPYAVDQAVTRSVYDDDLNCVQFWQNIAVNGTDAVEAEIKRGLEGMFNDNGVSSPNVTIPDPIKTYVQYWPDAWHWLRAGTEGVTNADLYAWAVEPLSGEDVAMVGEAYNVQRSGWSDAAYKSSINLLNTRYGLDLPGAKRTVPTNPNRFSMPWSRRRN